MQTEHPLKYYRLAEGVAACLPSLAHADLATLAPHMEQTAQNISSHNNELSFAQLCRLSPETPHLLATIALSVLTYQPLGEDK